MMWWVVRGRNSEGDCVRFAVSEEEGEARAIAQGWSETALVASAEVRHQKILDDWSPGR